MRIASEMMNVPGAVGMAPAAAQPAQPGQPQGVMSTAVRPDVSADWPEGELPEQMMGDFKTLMPGIDVFKLPDNLAQLWEPIEREDTNPRSKTKGQKVIRHTLKFRRESPLVIVEGPNSGDVLTGNIDTNPRGRGKKDDPTTAWVSDAVYLLVNGLLAGQRPQLRQAGPTEHGDVPMIEAINAYAGRNVRIHHGLSGQCRGDRVVRLEYQDPTDTTFAAENRAPRTIVIEDPQARKGCGRRYYTRDFENKSPTSMADKYFTEVQCTGTYKDAAGQDQPCDAIVRGFPSIDGFLAPIGVK